MMMSVIAILTLAGAAGSGPARAPFLQVAQTKQASDLPLAATASRLGVSVTFLGSLIGAADENDVGQDALVQGLHDFGRAVNDGHFGRNNRASQILFQLNIPVDEAADHTIDVEKAFYAFSKAIVANKNPFTQETLAEYMDAGPLLPLLRLGPDKLKVYWARADSLLKTPNP